jgi:hypothetical protein
VSDDESRWRQGLSGASIAPVTITAWFISRRFNPGEAFLNGVFFFGGPKKPTPGLLKGK